MNTFNRRFGLFIAAGVLVLLCVVQIVNETEIYISHQESSAEKKESMYHEVAALADRLQKLRGGSAGKKGKSAIPSLLPWLEKEANRAQFAGHIREIAPVALQGPDSGLFREKATLGVVEISMESALVFIHQLEAVAELRIVRGDLRRSGKESGGVMLSMEIGLL